MISILFISFFSSYSNFTCQCVYGVKDENSTEFGESIKIPQEISNLEVSYYLANKSGNICKRYTYDLCIKKCTDNHNKIYDESVSTNFYKYFCPKKNGWFEVRFGAEFDCFNQSIQGSHYYYSYKQFRSDIPTQKIPCGHYLTTTGDPESVEKSTPRSGLDGNEMSILTILISYLITILHYMS